MNSGAIPGLSQDQLDTLVASPVLRGRAPGFAASVRTADGAITSGAGVRCMGQPALFDAETRLPIACMMKPILALACLELHVRGMLNIHERVTSYLPELAHQSGDGDTLTVAHLLSHTGGFVEPPDAKVRWSLDWNGFSASFRTRLQAFEPGAVWSYSQTGHAIIGKIIERIVAVDPLELILTKMLAPMGLSALDGKEAGTALGVAHTAHRTSFAPMKLPQSSRLFRTSISEMTLSIDSLAKLAGLLSGRVRPPFVSAAAYNLFSSPTIEIPSLAAPARREATPSAYGLGLAHYGALIGQSGSYVGSTFAIRSDPVSGASAAVGSNAWIPVIRDRIIDETMSRVTGLAKMTGASATPARPLQAYVGRYKALLLGCGEAELCLNDGGAQLHLYNTPTACIDLRLDDGGRLSIFQPTATLSVGLAVTPTGEPYLFVGMSAYKRIAPA